MISTTGNRAHADDARYYCTTCCSSIAVWKIAQSGVVPTAKVRSLQLIVTFFTSNRTIKRPL